VSGRNLGLVVGAFLSAMFLVTGLAATLAFGPRLARWWSAGDWPATRAVVLDAELQSLSGARGSATWRPWLRFQYQWKGETHVAEGYDLLGVYTSRRSTSQHVVQSHPPGTQVTVLVNPDRPSEAALVRGSLGSAIFLLLGPVFVTVGIAGGLYTLGHATGAFAGRGALAGAHRAGLSFLLRASVMKAIVFGGFGVAILALLAATWLQRSIVPAIFAGIIGWGLWIASRPRKAGR
jgi:hypothetical protein